MAAPKSYTEWPGNISAEDRKALAERPIDHGLYEQHWPHCNSVELVEMLEKENNMLREENARLGRALFEARYKDWL
jgi:hypothetical protein